jgi:sugar lactone lactonase YvrE
MKYLAKIALIIAFIFAMTSSAWAAFSDEFEFRETLGSYGTGLGQFRFPTDAAIDADGNMFIVDLYRAVQRYDGSWYQVLTQGYNDPKKVNMAEGIAIDGLGRLHVTNTWGSPGMADKVYEIISVAPYLNYIMMIGIPWSYLPGGLILPCSVAIGPGPDYLVAIGEYGYSNRVQIFSSDGTFLFKVGDFEWACGVAIDADGNIYVLEEFGNKLSKFTSSGTLIWTTGSYSTGGEPGTFYYPRGVAVDADGNVYVADSGNNRIQKFDSDGIFQWEFSSAPEFGSFNYCCGIKLDSDGNLYVVDSSNYRVVIFDALGAGVIEVAIDIKPEGYPNSINLGSNGVVPVAILSTADFDATTIDPATVVLAGATVRVRGKSDKYLAAVEDVNGDGIPDLLVHVEATELELTVGDVEAELTGFTEAGDQILGIDTVRIVP